MLRLFVSLFLMVGLLTAGIAFTAIAILIE